MRPTSSASAPRWRSGQRRTHRISGPREATVPRRSRPIDLHARVASLGARYGLTDDAVGKLEALLELLAEDPLAPTAIHDPLTALDDHLADSLVALELEPVVQARQAVDLGSGAGVPGLPLAIALPAAAFVLVESSARKCEFIERAARVCEIGNVDVVHARAEAWPEGFGRFDLATARALASLDVVAEYAAPLLRIGGTLVAWRGRRDAEVEASASRAAAELGMDGPDVAEAQPYPEAQHRHLYLLSKVMDTPARFPRRPGIASKRPLGATPARPRRAV
jgi:16S rRNA (guanine527-N7)-methyltransferase